MAELTADARIRDLKKRLELDPSSRLFVTLAEEYRKIGRLPEALSTLQKGLLAHPGYLSAHVALGRAYLEAGQITESIATFNKVLAADPGNLVSAKSLADIYLSRGESVEAIKKYKLYRALSGDKKVDEIVERLQQEIAPPPAPKPEPPPIPPPPTFFAGKTGPVRTSIKEVPRPRRSEPNPDETATALAFELDESTRSRRRTAGPPPVLSRDTEAPLPEPTAAATASPHAEPPRFFTEPPPPALTEFPAPPAIFASEDVSTRALRVADVLAPTSSRQTPVAAAKTFRKSGPAVAPEPGAPAEPAPAPPADRRDSPLEPRGRTLADLYYAQGHFAEALAIYDDLVAANPFDAELKRLRRDAEARLLPAGSRPSAVELDSGLKRRLARVRALKHWLAVVQTG